MRLTYSRPDFLTSVIAFCILLTSSTGCNTLSSFGLPFGGSGNKLIETAQTISESETRSIAAPKELLKQPLANYFVEIGDSILVEAVKFDATIRLPGDQIIKPDGHISLGEFGEYMAVGKTIDQIGIEVQQIIDDHIRQDREVALEVERRQREDDRRIAQRRDLANAATEDTEAPDTRPDAEQSDELSLGAIEDEEARIALERRIAEAISKNEISVRLVTWDSKKIYVLGEVNSPGSFDYDGTHTVLDAIIEAGGLSSKANEHHIIVARPTTCSSCRIVMTVCYDQVVQLGDTSTNYQLQPGDRVFVPALTFCEDLKQSLSFNKDQRCPRCAGCQSGCDLPNACE
jgi:polysaccharide export outer membrane protein